MSDRADPDFFSSGRSWYTFHGAACLMIIVIVSIPFSPLQKYIKSGLVYPFLFQAREFLGKTPPLSPKLKIFTLDSHTVSYLEGLEPKPEELIRLLINIGKKNPKAIILDGLMPRFEKNGKNDYEALKDEKLNIYSGLYLSQKPFRHRYALDSQMDYFRIESYLNPEIDVFNLEVSLDNKFDAVIYGPSKQLANVFSGLGHKSYNRDGTISPFYRISSDFIIPHLSIYAADSVYIDQKELHINNHKVPMNKKGRVVINFRPAHDLYQITSSLHPLLIRAQLGETESSVEEGDVVLILLSMASGQGDFYQDSPFGEVPNEMILAAMISSILDFQWIESQDISLITILILAILGTLLGIHARAPFFWSGMIFVNILFLALTVYLFAFLSIEISFVTPCLAFCSTGLLYFTHKKLNEEIKLVAREKHFLGEKIQRLEEQTHIAELDSYLEIGKAVRSLLLPENMSGTLSSCRYHLLYVPHLKMAGDWFYVWNVSNDESRFLMGDVMGKGPSAAIAIACIISLLKDCEMNKMGLLDTLHKLNARLVELFGYHMTCTLATASIFKDGTCKLINTGSPGWFLHSHEKTEFFMLRSTPLGLGDHITIEEKMIQLESNQTLFSVTDGYLEGSRNLKRLIQALEQNPNSHPDLDYLTGILSSIQISKDAEDDRSLIFIKYLG